jgi:voltage-gated potassium channel
LGDAPAGTSQGAAYDRVQRMLEWPMMVLALAFVGAMVLQDHQAAPAEWREVGRVADWAIWALFVAEYLAMLALARDRARFVRGHVLDLVVIAVPALRVLRLARALRLARMLRPLAALSVTGRQWAYVQASTRSHKLAMLAAACLLVLLVGAYLMYLAEGAVNEGFSSYGVSLWWAMVTATTVGYGDAAPETAWGRAIACLFMVVGVAVFGLVSASIAAHFVEQDSREEWQRLETRLDEITEVLRDVRAKLAVSEAGTDRDGTGPTGS